MIWRGIAVWDKTEGSRPRLGGFRSQSEFVVWGTNGPMDDAAAATVGVLPGVFRHVVRQDDKFHITGKPTALMKDIVHVCRPGGIILDPFCGSGTTLVAALLTGRRSIGFERTKEYSEIARQRCAGCAADADWRRPEQGALFGGAR
jgi:site-specific DNA-methyltransferase (adenine-specific)